MFINYLEKGINTEIKSDDINLFQQNGRQRDNERKKKKKSFLVLTGQ